MGNYRKTQTFKEQNILRKYYTKNGGHAILNYLFKSSRSRQVQRFHIPDYGSAGVGIESNRIKTALDEIGEHLQETYSNIRFVELLGLLIQDVEPYFEASWDGYDAEAVSIQALIEAISFLELLPPFIPIPELVPVPTGEIAFEWYREENRLFSISFTGDRQLVYAGMYGLMSTTHGTEYFSGSSIPSPIFDNILRLYK